jgi:hypothetical protein
MVEISQFPGASASGKSGDAPALRDFDRYKRRILA